MDALFQINFSDGFVSIAVQQGGIGILLTVLLISTPPMAASFFQGTLGSFAHYTAWQGAGNAGQRPGEAGYRGQQQTPQENSSNGSYPGGWGAGQQSSASAPPSYKDPATNPNYGKDKIQSDVVKTAPNRSRTE